MTEPAASRPRGIVVKWVGKARRAAEAVRCPTCNVTIGEPCDWSTFGRGTGPWDQGGDFHSERDGLAGVLGFIEVEQQQGSLFE